MESKKLPPDVLPDNKVEVVKTSCIFDGANLSLNVLSFYGGMNEPVD